MKILDIYLRNFRKFNDFNISFDDKFLINGPTGSGKTSIIESCYLSMSGKSFRTVHLKEIVKNDRDNFFTKCSIEDISGYKRSVTSGADSSGNRRITVDGKITTRKDLVNIITSVIHTPEDISIIDGVPSKRRDFLDRAAFIEERDYFDDLFNYSRYLKQKSVSLKKNNKKAVIYLNEAVVPLIDRIRKKRMNICEKINSEISKTVENIFPDLLFEISSQVDDNIIEKLKNKLDRELEKGYPLYGPHLDVINIKYQMGSSKNMSMGEKYLVSAILKLSELYLHAKTDIYPLFFMDDAFVFLDSEKKAILLGTILKLKNQTIMTSSIENLNKTNDLTVYKIS